MSVSLAYTVKKGNRHDDHEAAIAGAGAGTSREVAAALARIVRECIRVIDSESVSSHQDVTVAIDNTSSRLNITLTPASTAGKFLWSA